MEKRLVFAALAVAGAVFGQSLSFEVVDRQVFTLPSRPLPAVAVRGEFYFIDYDQRTLYRISTPGAGVQQIHLSRVPAAQPPEVRVDRDLAVDAQGRFYVLASRRRAACVLRFGPDGAYDRTILLTPPSIARHVAIDDEGHILTIGSPRILAGPRGPCLFLHEYDMGGRRMASFSQCPPRQPGRTTQPDSGVLWVSAGRVYHLLPESRELRVFDAGGGLVHSISFQAPVARELLARHGVFDSPYVRPRVWRILPLPDGRFLLDWFHSGVRYLCLHGARGTALSDAAEPSPSLGAPLFVDRTGYCCFLRKLSDTRFELLRTRVRAPAPSSAPGAPIAQ